MVLATSELPPAPPLALVPRTAPSLALHSTEALATGIPRIAVDQLDWMLYLLRHEPDRDLAVHEVRKAAKCARAVLRLVRGHLGYYRYREENVVLRDVARRLGPTRSLGAAVETIDAFGELGRDPLPASSRVHLRERLLARQALAARDVAEHAQLTIDAVVTLLAARERYRSWPVSLSAEDESGRRPFPDRFTTIAPGLQLTYARGRGAMRGAAAHPATHQMHVWRKRAKYLRHQLRTIENIAPDELAPLVEAYAQLGELLGTEHDLAELHELIVRDPSLIVSPHERASYLAALDARRRNLQMAALRSGADLYAYETHVFAARLRRLWEAHAG